jgi:hypothetical protein
MADLRQLLELRNFREVHRVLAALADDGRASFVLDAAADQARLWLSLARDHLSAARSASTRHWRSQVSRSYYAAYTASRAVRYYVTGHVRQDAGDHKDVTELPDDFPDRSHWVSALTDLHSARSRSDYDAWTDVLQSLPREPSVLLSLADRFVATAARYLTDRGV